MIIKSKNVISINPLIAKYMETKDTKYLDEAIKIIKSGTINDIVSYFYDTDLLFYKDETGTLFAEYLLAYNVQLSSILKEWIFEDMRVVMLFLDYGRLDYDVINEKILFSEVEPGKNLVEYLFERNLIEPDVISKIEHHEEIIDYISKYNREDLIIYLNDYFIFNASKNDTKIIDYLFRTNQVDDRFVERIEDTTEIYDYLIKYNRTDLTSSLSETVLNMKKNGKDTTILEELIINNYEIPDYLCEVESFKTLLKYKRYDILCDLSEYRLLTKIDGNKTLLEILLENNIKPKLFLIDDIKSINVFIKLKRYDLLSYCTIGLLLKHMDLNKTYLDFMLEEFKKDPKSINITTINTKICFRNDYKAQLYLEFAKHGLIEYIGKPSAYDLMYADTRGKKLIDILLELDEKTTLECLIDKTIFDIDLFLYLKIRGIKKDGLLFGENMSVLAEEHVKSKNAKVDELPISSEAQSLLDRFRNIMLLDGASNLELVDNMIRSYRKAISSGSKYALKELELLISIKHNNKNFTIVEDAESSAYSTAESRVYLHDFSFVTNNHELGHAMFDLLAGEVVPPDYEKLAEKIRNNPLVIEKVAKLSDKYYEIIEKIKKQVEETFLANYEDSIIPERKRDIEAFLELCKEEKIKELEETGCYTKKELEALMSEVFTYEEYIKQEKEFKREQLVSAILEEEYAELFIVADIVDSIFEGKFFDDKLTTKDGKKIKGCTGHGIKYYVGRGLDVQFNENVANFSAIFKSSNPKMILDVLRSIVGNEFVDLMINYYEKNIVESKKYERSV